MAKIKHLISVQDLTDEELKEILDQAGELKEKQKSGEPHESLRGKTLGMIFAKPSTRTRVSFETAMTQLGGHAIYLGWDTLQLGRGETISDTAQTLSRYVDAVTARLFEHEKIKELAENSGVPVINGLTDLLHPCQAISDLFTIREQKDGFEGLKLAYIGDGNNVCHSLLLSCAKVGMNTSIATPKGYEPNQEIVEKAKQKASEKSSKVKILTDPEKAAFNADVIYTDVISSMGQEEEREQRLKDFQGYQVNSELLSMAKEDVIFMHCLPAHRGEEVTAEVIDGPNSVVFDQAENRLHSQKAILVMVV
ncbi:ornithine carbamoyltransferase [candidate division MSBL1 archaeon SCGC-AAA261O19]|uniref:Ornithine carbamoyltransferase n=2 Tax=candidate division MSBL1 TaxID=215777 RepID=A0A133UZF8_9EURY|nr:ornithine carbamoyltransferase [candidate division MSBL1 archaeon SCGC-AAA261C02]KXB04330.1 ornithine carbamoyltransferase [candidate division MSBL1 archaeon SCGC-AAA261O19]